MNAAEFFSRKGRMRRKHYVVVYLIVFVSLLIIGYAQRATGDNLSFLTFLVVAGFIPPSVRRLHDMGYSGWLVIGVIAIPLAVFVLLLVPSEAKPNEYGANPT